VSVQGDQRQDQYWHPSSDDMTSAHTKITVEVSLQVLFLMLLLVTSVAAQDSAATADTLWGAEPESQWGWLRWLLLILGSAGAVVTVVVSLLRLRDSRLARRNQLRGRLRPLRSEIISNRTTAEQAMAALRAILPKVTSFEVCRTGSFTSTGMRSFRFPDDYWTDFQSS
jgi:hypothetical protein